MLYQFVHFTLPIELSYDLMKIYENYAYFFLPLHCSGMKREPYCPPQGNNTNEKCQKKNKFRINPRMCKWSIAGFSNVFDHTCIGIIY